MEPGDKIVVMGAGPAGLAACDAFVRRGFAPEVLEAGARVGGLSRTEVHRGNRLDLGERDKRSLWEVQAGS